MNKYYSDEVPKILDVVKRKRIGNQIFRVLKIHCKNLSNLRVLDYGCSTGVISDIISKKTRSVVGIDVDKKAITMARKKFKRSNLKFKMTNCIKTDFKDEYFDIIIANQIYEFVDSDKELMKELYRLLKTGGVCFFGARNKYAIIEAQYNIPFLSWLPFQVPGFVGKYRSYFGLKSLAKNFTIHDYTSNILLDPVKYGFDKLEKYKWLFKILPLKLIISLIPNYIWILEKK